MSQEIYNDVTIAWTPSAGAAVTVPHTQCKTDDGAADVPTTAVGDAEHTSSDGICDPSVTVSFDGSGAGLVLGTYGALAVGNMAGTLANCAIFEDSVEGQEDGQVTGSVTILPIPAP
jgi:hypothetical protein